MRSRETMTISLPPAMLRVVEAASRAEHRTRSELVREALRAYLYQRYPVVSASRAELAAIARGRAQVKRGDFLTLEQLAHDLESANRKACGKGARKTSR